MTVKEYFSTAFHTDEEAKIIGVELERLNRERRCTAPDILAAATPKNAPLHEFFEWDNSKAATEFRLAQARNLARHIGIRIVDKKTGRVREVRAFYAVTLPVDDADAPRSYISIERVNADPALRIQVIAQAKQQLLSWRKRYDDYSEIFAPIFEAIDQLTLEEEVRAA